MAIQHHEKIIIYGTGLEGEKFYCKYAKQYEIVYCLDKRKRGNFHGKKVYSLDEIKTDAKKYYLVVTVGTLIYHEVRAELQQYGFKEFENFIWSGAFEKRIVFLYGNCHMAALEQYLNTNPFFVKNFFARTYDVTREAPEEMIYCDLLITQDIREDNYLGMASCDELIKKHATGENIIIPNLYGYNMFFPQINYRAMIDIPQRNVQIHLSKEAIDMDSLGERGKEAAHNFTYWMFGGGDLYIDAMHHMGYTVAEIKNDILYKEIWSKKEIQDNFDATLAKIREREKKCDLTVSDYIENNYQKYRMFYNPNHPTGMITRVKGEYILQYLGLEAETELYFDNGLGADEMPIYGCVKKALGLTYEQRIYRRNSCYALTNRPEDLEEYIANYIAWVWN